MRVDLNKYIFIGLNDEKEKFFKEIQKLGLVDFLDLSHDDVPKVDPDVAHILEALKVLRRLESPEKQAFLDLYQYHSIVDDILGLKNQIEKLHEKSRLLALEESRIKPFGHFNALELSEIEKASHLKAQFFAAKSTKDLTGDEYKDLIYVSSDEALDYFVVFKKENVNFSGLVEMQLSQSLKNVQDELKQTKTELYDLQKELKTYAKYNDYLHLALNSELDHFHLQKAKDFTAKPLKRVFAAAGFVPVNKVSLVKTLADEMSVHMEETAIGENEVVPTYLENEGMARIGEDVIGVYDTPSNTDDDPSLWVLLSFGLFFAFIVGDGGYGTIWLGFCLWFKYKYPNLKKGQKRLLNLAFFLCIMTILWGFFANSFFGISLSPDNPLREYSPLNWLVQKKAEWAVQHPEISLKEWLKKSPALAAVKDGHSLLRADSDLSSSFVDNVLLELALLVGVIHVILGMLRYIKRNWAFYGWIIFVVGCYLYLPTYLGVPSILNFVLGIDWAKGGEIGLILISIGFPLAILLAVIKNKWLGLTEIMNVVTIFADILSYLRLYALGLAGGIMAGVINDAMVSLPLALGLLIALIAHTVNMGLGIMSGVVHGLRLNFLEWYHYSFEGNGRKFKPLDLQNKELS